MKTNAPSHIIGTAIKDMRDQCKYRRERHVTLYDYNADGSLGEYVEDVKNDGVVAETMMRGNSTR